MIQSVQRALDILSFFSIARPSLGIGELSDLMGLPRATVHGLVRTLLQKGFLQQDPETRRYSLGFKVHELGAILGSTLEINRKSSAPLYDLARRTRLEARISIWDGDSVLLTMGASVRSQAFFARIGPRMPAYCSASGKVFLAYMSREDLEGYLGRTKLARHTSATLVTRSHILKETRKIRTQGYATNRDELIRGLVAFAAPIFGRSGGVEAAISISLMSGKIEKKAEPGLIEELLMSAALISRDMGYSPEHDEPAEGRLNTQRGGFQ
jgi:IclR family transcriptional regulator, KDG regulon repressor